MRVYAVYEPPWTKGGASEAVFIPEGFAWGAFVFGPFWALWLGLLRWSFLLLAALLGLFALAGLAGFDEAALAAALFGFALYCGFAGNDRRQQALERRGYRFAGVVAARNRLHAELRHFGAAEARPLR